MKLSTLILSLLFLSLPSEAALNKLNFNQPHLQVKKVVIKKPMQTNLIRLYLNLPSEKRMIAGYKSSLQRI